jgi:hypothetical protein
VFLAGNLRGDLRGAGPRERVVVVMPGLDSGSRFSGMMS